MLYGGCSVLLPLDLRHSHRNVLSLPQAQTGPAVVHCLGPHAQACSLATPQVQNFDL